MVPRATYRVQFGKNFGFDDAAASQRLRAGHCVYHVDPSVPVYAQSLDQPARCANWPRFQSPRSVTMNRRLFDDAGPFVAIRFNMDCELLR